MCLKIPASGLIPYFGLLNTPINILQMKLVFRTSSVNKIGQRLCKTINLGGVGKYIL